MTFNKEQAEKIGAIFGLADEAVAWGKDDRGI
jgi:hypothetical protein